MGKKKNRFLGSINNAIEAALLKKNLTVMKPVGDRQLGDFLRRVRPHETNHPLVRLGQRTDGGYLLPDDLAGVSACFSPGVSNVVHFELAMAQRGIPCFMADYSVASLPVENPLFSFQKKYLGYANDDVNMTLENWVRQNTSESHDLLLQMDIEGAEYATIAAAPAEVLRQFRIMVIEFHRLDLLFDRLGFSTIDSAFQKLLVDFTIVHIHPNNNRPPYVRAGVEIPRTMEFTFLRNDRITSRKPALRFPHPLDAPNVPHLPDYALPRVWYGG